MFNFSGSHEQSSLELGRFFLRSMGRIYTQAMFSLAVEKHFNLIGSQLAIVIPASSDGKLFPESPCLYGDIHLLLFVEESENFRSYVRMPNPFRVEYCAE